MSFKRTKGRDVAFPLHANGVGKTEDLYAKRAKFTKRSRGIASLTSPTIAPECQQEDSSFDQARPKGIFPVELCHWYRICE